jgi:hypothetical protein
MVSYTARPLVDTPPEERRLAYETLQTLCAPSGANARQLSIKGLVYPDPQPLIDGLTLGRLYDNDKLVGGIVYQDSRPAIREIMRLFVCAERGYGRAINEEFEKKVLQDDTGRVDVRLNAIVDPERKVAKFHMLNGYKINGMGKSDVETLAYKKNEIPMVKRLPADPLTDQEKQVIEESHAEAAKLRARRNERMSTLRPRGGRRRITRRWSSISARKRSRRRRASVRGA